MEEVNWYETLKPVVHKLMILLFHPEIKGEKIKEEGNIILAGNHIHFLDAILLTMATDRQVYILAKEELFTGIKKVFFESMGCIPVDRSGKGMESIREALVALEEDKCIGIFAEGTRNKTDDIILPFKLGTVAIAKRSKTNIVPFAISGKYRLIRNNLTLTIGKEIETDKYSSSELLEKLETDVKELILKK